MLVRKVQTPSNLAPRRTIRPSPQVSNPASGNSPFCDRSPAVKPWLNPNPSSHCYTLTSRLASFTLQMSRQGNMLKQRKRQRALYDALPHHATLPNAKPQALNLTTYHRSSFIPLHDIGKRGRCPLLCSCKSLYWCTGGYQGQGSRCCFSLWH